MTRIVRYVLFGLVFGLVLLGLFTKSSAIVLVSVVAAVVFGLITEKFDNSKDEKFKRYNEIHPHFPQ